MVTLLLIITAAAIFKIAAAIKNSTSMLPIFNLNSRNLKNNNKVIYYLSLSDFPITQFYVLRSLTKNAEKRKKANKETFLST